MFGHVFLLLVLSRTRLARPTQRRHALARLSAPCYYLREKFRRTVLHRGRRAQLTVDPWIAKSLQLPSAHSSRYVDVGVHSKAGMAVWRRAVAAYCIPIRLLALSALLVMSLPAAEGWQKYLRSEFYGQTNAKLYDINIVATPKSGHLVVSSTLGIKTMLTELTLAGTVVQHQIRSYNPSTDWLCQRLIVGSVDGKDALGLFLHKDAAIFSTDEGRFESALLDGSATWQVRQPVLPSTTRFETAAFLQDGSVVLASQSTYYGDQFHPRNQQLRWISCFERNGSPRWQRQFIVDGDKATKGTQTRAFTMSQGANGNISVFYEVGAPDKTYLGIMQLNAQSGEIVRTLWHRRPSELNIPYGAFAPDGSCLIVAELSGQFTGEPGANADQHFLICFGPGGDVKWTRTVQLRPSFYTHGLFLNEPNDRGQVSVAWSPQVQEWAICDTGVDSQQWNSTPDFFFAYGLSPLGTVTWSRTYGRNSDVNYKVAASITATSDGWTMAGSAEEFGTQAKRHVYIVKTNSAGECPGASAPFALTSTPWPIDLQTTFTSQIEVKASTYPEPVAVTPTIIRPKLTETVVAGGTLVPRTIELHLSPVPGTLDLNSTWAERELGPGSSRFTGPDRSQRCVIAIDMTVVNSG